MRNFGKEQRVSMDEIWINTLMIKYSGRHRRNLVFEYVRLTY